MQHPVAMQQSLGQASRSGGVHQQCRIVGGRLDRPEAAIVVRQAIRIGQHSRSGLVDGDDMLQLPGGEGIEAEARP